MKEGQKIMLGGMEIPLHIYNTVVVGTGCAGYNAADSLYAMGQEDVAIVTEGINMGTSRNTGSDKQTYYKLTLAGDGADSVAAMAETFFAGGSMHGDIALIEAATSPRNFYKLVNLGVGFPHNPYGEYVGYKTDHDPRQRATSCGPLTSKMMTEKLQKSVESKNIPLFDGYRVIGIITENSRALGFLAMNIWEDMGNPRGFALFRAANIIYAVGGPSAIYHSSVYPPSQTCGLGAAFAAGAKGINLTESQYGIASVQFRWNLSGTYQQVIPTYFSTSENREDPKEFLPDYFDSPSDMLNAIFLKGYQWPFDPRKLGDRGSSKVDLAVYHEKRIKGRRVFMDFRVNPACMMKKGKPDFTMLGEEARSYLENSGAFQQLPLERLHHMNRLAAKLYWDNGIDLSQEPLEIDVCAQHNNGGLLGDIWWESNIRGFFPVGEANGTFGVYRPGGSALNSTQTGSLRAAMLINAHYRENPEITEEFTHAAKRLVDETNRFITLLSSPGKDKTPPLELRETYQKAMDLCGAFIRPVGAHAFLGKKIRENLNEQGTRTQVQNKRDLLEALINRDILITQLVYVEAIENYIRKGGKSRGSYLICQDGNFHCFETGNTELDSMVCEAALDTANWETRFEWKPTRPIPKDRGWFENVYNQYINGEFIH